MLNKEDILALAWEHSEGSGKCYTFTEESLFEFLNELKKDQASAQDEREAFEARMVLEAGPGADDLWIKGNPNAGYSNERVNDHRFGWVACLEWMTTRPAQPCPPKVAQETNKI